MRRTRWCEPDGIYWRVSPGSVLIPASFARDAPLWGLAVKSPFPGMDPYLESFWGDVHTSLTVYARNQLRGQLPPDLRVRVEEQVTVQIASEENGKAAERRRFYPDVRVVEHPQGGGPPESAVPAPAALTEPLVIPLEVEAQTQRSLRIIDSRSGNRVVTAIEFLSPANKSEPSGRAAYRRKQTDLREARVNLVEIDLVREGQYVLAVPMHLVPQPYLVPYRICVIRGYRPDQAEVYRVSFRARLPAIHIPLREGDADARLDLQDLIDKSYEDGGYARDIDYRVDPQPALQGDDAAWADGLLREKGLR